MHAYIYVNLMPTFGLSFFVSENILNQLTRVCSNYSLLSSIFGKYFEYRHIQDRINRTKFYFDKVIEIQISGSQSELNRALRRYEGERKSAEELIRGNIRGSLDLYSRVIKELREHKSQIGLDFIDESYLEERYEYFQKDKDVIALATKHNIDLSKRPKY